MLSGFTYSVDTRIYGYGMVWVPGRLCFVEDKQHVRDVR